MAVGTRREKSLGKKHVLAPHEVLGKSLPENLELFTELLF